MKARLATATDRDEIARMRTLLWVGTSIDEQVREVDSLLAGGPSPLLPSVLFVAEDVDRSLTGFIEVGLRSHADGCDPAHPVGFVEGWFVRESARRSGAGKALMQAAEQWARNRGCREMASDTWIDNEGSQRAHEALGFTVVDRCVNYRKDLS